MLPANRATGESFNKGLFAKGGQCHRKPRRMIKTLMDRREMSGSWREPYLQRKVARGTDAPSAHLVPSDFFNGASHWTDPAGSQRHETSADVTHTGQPPGWEGGGWKDRRMEI